MVDYGSSVGLQHNPVTISQAAIAYFDCWRSAAGTAEQADADRVSFFAQANWLLANQQPDGRWFYTFKWGGQPLPWWSAMAEGQGMSALLRAYSVTGDGAYLAALARARSTFDRTIADLGVGRLVTVSGKHLSVYQEYLPGYVDNVLNGWISALGGLYECAIYLGDPIALHDLAAADRGLSALRALLPYYDTGSWSFYGLNTLVGQNRGPRASSAYHNLVIRQLRWLYSITGDPVMKKYADRFQSYVTSQAVIGGTFDPGQPDPGFPVGE
jgi:heparosan-N-sulfate-glucuronate 5-epimerase